MEQPPHLGTITFQGTMGALLRQPALLCRNGGSGGPAGCLYTQGFSEQSTEPLDGQLFVGQLASLRCATTLSTPLELIRLESLSRMSER